MTLAGCATGLRSCCRAARSNNHFPTPPLSNLRLTPTAVLGERQARHLKTTTTLGAANTPPLVMYHYSVKDSRAAPHQAWPSPAYQVPCNPWQGLLNLLRPTETEERWVCVEELAYLPRLPLNTADAPNVLLRGEKNDNKKKHSFAPFAKERLQKCQVYFSK